MSIVTLLQIDLDDGGDAQNGCQCLNAVSGDPADHGLVAQVEDHAFAQRAFCGQGASAHDGQKKIKKKKVSDLEFKSQAETKENSLDQWFPTFLARGPDRLQHKPSRAGLY